MCRFGVSRCGRGTGLLGRRLAVGRGNSGLAQGGVAGLCLGLERLFDLRKQARSRTCINHLNGCEYHFYVGTCGIVEGTL